MHAHTVPCGKRLGVSSERKGIGIKDRDGYTMSPCVQGMSAFVKDQEHEDLVVVNNHNISAQIWQTAGEPGTKRWAISIPRTLNMKRADGITRRNFQPPAHDLSYCAAIARPLLYPRRLYSTANPRRLRLRPHRRPGSCVPVSIFPWPTYHFPCS